MKRWLSLLLCAVMLLGLFTVSAQAINQVPSGYTGIYTAADFNNIRNNMSGKYILMANIDLSGYTAWTSFGYAAATADQKPFTGVLDGNGYKITGCVLNGGHNCYGLFWKNSGVIRNLSIYGDAKSYGGTTAVLAGYNTGTIENCHNYANFSHMKTMPSLDMYIGGLVGHNSGTIRYCSNRASVTARPGRSGSSSADGYTGGIVGYNAGTVEKCWNTGAIDLESTSMSCFAGGIAGYLAAGAAIRDCYNTGTLLCSSGTNSGYSSAMNFGVGGIFGLGDEGTKTAQNCFNYGKLTLDAGYHSKYRGPICGLGNGTTFTNCYYLDTTYTGTSSRIKLTATQMRQQSSFSGFNFSTVWTMGSSYPVLRIPCTHTVAYNAAVNATCTTDGNIAYYDCNVCGLYFNNSSKSQPLTWSQIKVPAAHTPGTAVIENETAGTCEVKASHDSVVYCSVCGDYEISRETVYGDFADHAWSDWTAQGAKLVRVCGTCGTGEEMKNPDYVPVNPFTDVTQGAFYYDPVLWAVEQGITAGVSADRFAPDLQCTRGQVVTFLWRAMGCPEPASTQNPFTDVAENTFYYKAVLWAVEQGITNGTSAVTFSPEMYCTRSQVVTFLWRAMEQPEISGANHPFTDVSANSFYYTPMLWAVENGITSGVSKTSFAPDAPCTRGQVVTFLHRAMN